jgi:pimeloyl-ACP methyl ester carboxylesterase
MQIQHIRVGPVNVRYQRRGSGSVLLLLHGGGGEADHSYYDEFAQLVSPPFETIAYDQRDCGGSVFPGEHSYTLADIAEEAVNFIRALGFERVHVLGTSAGGLVAQLIALRWPEHVDHLILNVIGPLNELDNNPGLLERRAKLLKMEDYKGFAELFSTPAYVAKHPEMVEKIKSLVTTSTHQQRRVAALLGTRPNVDLGKIRHKTMVIAGEEDQLVPLSAARKLASVIPNAELRIIPAAGHTALLENPAMYSSLVKGFLTNDFLQSTSLKRALDDMSQSLGA